MNPIQQLSPDARLWLTIMRGHAALVLGDTEELRRFLDELKQIESPERQPQSEEEDEQNPPVSPFTKGGKTDPPVSAVVGAGSCARPGKEETDARDRRTEAFSKAATVAIQEAARTIEPPQESNTTAPEEARPRLRGFHKRPTEEEIAFAKERLAKGDGPTHIVRLLREKFGPDRGLHFTTIYAWKKKWEEEGELVQRDRRRQSKTAVSLQSRLAPALRRPEAEIPASRLITAGKLADILDMSDGALAQQANYSNWPRRDGQFIVDNLPAGVRQKVEAALAKEAA